MQIVDFPKIKSPFVREHINGRYIVTPKIEPGYEWIFDDGVRAVDKLHGTNLCVVIENGDVKAIHNRKNIIFDGDKPLLSTSRTTAETRIVEGVMKAIGKKWIHGKEGYVYGELIGPTINGNMHLMDHHLFVPFEYLQNSCHWKSWIRSDFPKTFDNISEWFKDDLHSLFTLRHTGKFEPAEGVIFTHPDGRMAKMRRDFFDWYKGEEHNAK